MLRYIPYVGYGRCSKLDITPNVGIELCLIQFVRLAMFNTRVQGEAAEALALPACYQLLAHESWPWKTDRFSHNSATLLVPLNLRFFTLFLES